MADLRASLPTTQASNLAAEIPSGPLGLQELRKMFDDSQWLCRDARQDSQTSRDYYDGYQLTDKERQVLTDRKQPPVVINRVQRSIDGIIGVLRQGKTDPRALMRNPPDDLKISQPAPRPQMMNGAAPGAMQQPPANLDAGDVASMALRYMADTTHFEEIQIDVAENGLIEGCGAAITESDEKGNVSVTQIRWEEFFFDPYSRRYDFRDARYLGIAKWMYADTLAAMYPDSAKALGDFSASGTLLGMPDSTWEDRPVDGGGVLNWVDGKKRRVMVIEMYHQDKGEWHRCVLYAAAILAYGLSPYKGDDDETICPIEGWSAYIDRNNNRYGPVKGMRDIQDEINMRRSKALHEINTRQVQQVNIDMPPIDVGTVRQEAAKPDGVIPPGWQIVPRQDQVANNLTLLSEAKNEIERLAPNPAILGRQGADASGRAQQIRQQAGMTELAPILGRHADWKRRMYGQMWQRARQYWNGPKWIRVTNDNDAPSYIQINEPGQAVPGRDPQTGLPTLMPGPPSNHIAKMDIDIVLEEVPDTATLEQEVFAELSQLAQVYGPQNVPFEVILEASSLPKKRELINKLRQFQAQQAQQQGNIAQMQAAEQQAKTQKTMNEASNAGASALQKEASIDLTKAQTGLIEVQTVEQAMLANIHANAAAQLPPGFTIGPSGQHVPLKEPPPPGPANAGTGADTQP